MQRGHSLPVSFPQVRRKMDKTGSEAEGGQAAEGATWGMGADAPAEEEDMVDDETADSDAGTRLVRLLAEGN